MAPREVRNVSIEEAHRRLEEQLEPSNDWPTDVVNDRMEAAEEAAIAELEAAERAAREDSGF